MTRPTPRADEECASEGRSPRRGIFARSRAAATATGSGSSHGTGHAREVGLEIQETNEAGQTQSGYQDASAVATTAAAPLLPNVQASLATLKTLPYGDQTHKKALTGRRLHAL